MARFSTLVVPDRPCDNTASAALMKGWISSIFMRLDPRAGRVSDGAVFSHYVLDDFVQNFRLHRLLHEMPRPALQSRDNVFLIADGGDHHDAGVGMSLHDFLGSLDALHLRHGDIHQHDIGMRAVELADGSKAVAGFAGHLPAERFNHSREILAREDRIVHDQVADGLPVFASFYWCELLHNTLPFQFHHDGYTPAR